MQVYQRRHLRLAVLGGFFGCLLLVLVAGLAHRQLWQKPDYDEMEQRQIQRRVLQPGPRGDILDRHGRILVGNRARYSVVLYVNELRDEFRREFLRLRDDWLKQRGDDTSEARRTTNSAALQRQARQNIVQHYLDQANALLGRHDTLDDKEFEAHFSQNLPLPFVLINDLSLEEYARVNEEWPVASPMQTYAATARDYPYGSLAAHALGYVAVDSEAPAGGDLPGDNLRTFDIPGKIGREGLELSHNDQLRGITGGEIWIVDPGGFLYQRIQSKNPIPGANLQSSLDLDLQRVAETALGNKTGAVVALDVRTGEVLVMASHPAYNLNDMVNFATRSATADANDKNGAWLNRATEGLYPPGSTFKLVDSTAGLRAGLLDSNTTFTCGTELMVGNRAFKEHDGQSFGQVNLITALQKSSNVFFYQAGLLLGPERMAEQARIYGLDKPTHIDLAETHSMKVPDPLWKEIHHPHEGPWTDADTVMMAIGQSYLLVTPLQMACLVASIARDQTRTNPTLVHDPNLNPAAVSAGAQPLGLTPAERSLLLDGMEHVTQKGGTGYLARVPGVRVAAKTGTAQVVVKGNDNFTIAWFVGFAPIDNPQIAIAVAIEGTDPNDNYHGGATAGPIAGAVLNQYFRPQSTAGNLPPKN